ncbi:uncharacterized protein LOC128893007 isoform X2 [Hylaeus anthracinus]|uniref:uncharacterized protein LOC128893007 isoform X2 n=1 Tax=Hylaeus anthracinus TaxID=313031 RepID=UPI0023B9F028|nr:uncharacterized protein LOC128893007 isoform X2 [Hylaeus anthracinus]
MTESVISDRFKQGLVWNDITIGNDVYVISVTWRNDTVHVFLTNLIELWMETLTNENILDRCRELNPLLDVEVLDYRNVVTNILSNMSKYIVEASIEQIKLRAHVNGGSMKFALHLSKGTPKNFWEIITKPLCISSMEIIRQHKILLDLIKRKDEEIAEYKAEGAELIRKNIETEIFKEECLKTNIFIPNIVKCTNTFQAMVNFYNTLNLSEDNEGTTKSTSIIKDDKMEQSTIVSSESDRAGGSKEGTNKDSRIKTKLESLSSKDKSKMKHTINEENSVNKARLTYMLPKRTKKPKKGLNDFLL